MGSIGSKAVTGDNRVASPRRRVGLVLLPLLTIMASAFIAPPAMAAKVAASQGCIDVSTEFASPGRTIDLNRGRAESGQVRETYAAARGEIVHWTITASVPDNSTATYTFSQDGGYFTDVNIRDNAAYSATGDHILTHPQLGIFTTAQSFGGLARITAIVSCEAPEEVTVTSPATTSSLTGKVGDQFSQSFTAAGGANFTKSGTSGPFSYTTTGTLPVGLTMSSGGTLSGKPTQFGTFNFTVTATDGYGVAGTSGSYTLEVENSRPIANAVTTTVAANSNANPVTLSISAGASDSVAIDTPAQHGTATASGNSITYTPTAGYSGPDSFTYTATNTVGTSLVAATVSVTVSKPTLSVAPASGSLPATINEAVPTNFSASFGTAPYTYAIDGDLPAGLTLAPGGTFTGAPTQLGSFQFTVNTTDAYGAMGSAAYTLEVGSPVLSLAPVTGTSFTGTAHVPFTQQFNATNGNGPYEFATSDALPAGLTLGSDGLLSGIPTEEGNFTFTVDASDDATGGIGEATYTLTIGINAEVVAIDGLLHDFIGTRLDRIASGLGTPTLTNRFVVPVTPIISAYAGEVTANVSASLAQIDALANPDAPPPAFNIWMDGTFSLFGLDEANAPLGTFGILSAGADYLLSEKALIGLSLHLDRTYDPSPGGELVAGDGWLAGPYTSFELGDGVFWNSSLLYGGSSNSVDTANWTGSFTTERWLVDSAVAGQWQVDELTTLSPKLRVVYLSETVADYTITSGPAVVVDMSGFTEEQLRASASLTLSHLFVLEDGTRVTPSLGVTGGYAGLGGSGAFGSLTAGVSMATSTDWAIDASVTANIEGDGDIAASARAGAAKRF